MAQRWERLAFLHWPVEAEALSRVLPPGIEPDEFEGSAWIGVTPFEIQGTRARLTPPLPVISSFPEINVRTYCPTTMPSRQCAFVTAGLSLRRRAEMRGSLRGTGRRVLCSTPRPEASSSSQLSATAFTP